LHAALKPRNKAAYTRKPSCEGNSMASAPAGTFEVTEIIEICCGTQWLPGKVLQYDGATGRYKIEKIIPMGNEIILEVERSNIRKMSKKKQSTLEEMNYGKPRVKYDITEGLPKVGA
jgi:hypothetical protein